MEAECAAKYNFTEQQQIGSCVFSFTQHPQIRNTLKKQRRILIATCNSITLNDKKIRGHEVEGERENMKGKREIGREEMGRMKLGD